jgi:cell division transport system permease protein
VILNVQRWKPGPLLPAPDARDGALVFVVAVLCFLSVLAAIGALAAGRAAQGWSQVLSATATVLVRPRGDQTSDAAATAAAAALSGAPGVSLARALPGEEAAALLTPWIGKQALPADLPLPRLVAVDLSKDQPATKAILVEALRKAAVDGEVDDHSLWIADVERSADLARWAAGGIAALVALAAAAVTLLATRAALAARREIVEVLHLSGARPGMIASLFQRRFGLMGAGAGLFGGTAAAMIALAARLAGGTDGLTPVLPVAWTDALVALVAPLPVGLVAAIAARLAALDLLRRMDGT